MTDRYHALTVVLEREIREDDAEHLLNAIRMMRGVADVRGEVSDLSLHIAKTTARRELWDKILAVFREDKE